MKYFIALAVVALAVACTGTSKRENEEAQAPRSLVLYYSQTGITRQVAEEIQRLTGADIESIELEEPYDGDFEATIARVQAEREAGTLPTLCPLQADLDAYDIIYLGYPIWFGTYAPPISALLRECDFAGKKVVPFCSFGSGGLEASARDLKASLPQADIVEGYGVRTARIDKMPAELERFLKENGYVEGEVAALPAFSEQQPVGQAEQGVFDMACGDYIFPLGSPLTFGKRTVGEATEYEFHTDQQTIIYVTERVEEGDMVTVEFTKVVR